MKTLGAIILLVGMAGVSAADRTPIQRGIAVPAGAPVRIVNVSGSVQVTGEARTDLQVAGTLGKGVERLDVVNEGGTIVVRVVLPKGIRVGDGSAALGIRMPAGSRLEVSTVSADQSVRGVTGAVQLTSVSGDVTAEGLMADVQAKTVSGDLQLTGAGKPAAWRAATVSGNLRLDRATGTVEVNTVSGDANLAVEQLASLRGRTTSGDVQVRGRVARGADVDYETVSGDLEVALGGEAGMQINATTFSGEIGTCFGVEPTSTSKYTPNKALNTRRGAGEAQVTLKTLSGDLTICDRP